MTDTAASPVAQLFAEFANSSLPIPKHSNALQNALVASTQTCYLVAITINNTNAAAQFIQLHDAGSVLADGAIPAVVFTVAGSSDKVVTYSLPGRFFFDGIMVCNSSTAATKTIGAADCFFDVQFIPVLPY